jgi:pSer/pThr/pTyr-binding forkhead associated (FHA) protein
MRHNELDEKTTQMPRMVVAPRRRPRRAHVLELTKGAGPKRVELKAERLVLGRTADADIIIESDEVSRQHAAFYRLDDEYLVEDLGSRNGVYLNGLKVHQAVLREGDELQFGDVVFLYQEGS